MSNPNFHSGERQSEAPTKEMLVRIPNRSLGVSSQGPLPLVVTQNQPFQQKAVGRAIAPAPGAVSQIGKATVHQINSFTPATLKKAEVHKAPLSIASAQSIPSSSIPAAVAAIPSIMQISSSVAPSISAVQMPGVSSIVRGASSSHLPVSSHVPAQSFSHLPRGAVVAANSALVRPAHTSTLLNVPRAIGVTPTAIQMPAGGVTLQPGIHGIRSTLIQQSVRSTTPPSNRAGSPAVSMGSAAPAEPHRSGISLHNPSTGATTQSIQITLQASRTTATEISRQSATTTYQTSGKVHMSPALNMSSQQKVVMSQSVTPGIQQLPTIAARSNKGPPVGSTPISTVTVALSTTTVTIPIISSATTTIPIAKVTPQRQQQQQTHQPTSSTSITSAPPDQPRGEPPTSYPQPMPAHTHAHSQAVSQSQPVAHSQPATSIFMPQGHRAPPSVASTMAAANVMSYDTREGMPPLPFLPHLMMKPDYHQFLVAAVNQQMQSGMLQNQPANLAATLQAHTIAQTTGSGVRINPMVIPMPVRQTTPQTTHTQFQATDTSSVTNVTSSGTEMSSLMSSVPIQMSGTVVPSLASSIYSNTQQPQIAQTAPSTPNTMTSSNPSASPRPSILRKRTNEGVSAVKKQLALSSTSDILSPRQDTRPDSTPQSNTSSPKTPASGESQSSTDTALSSEGTTPTGVSHHSPEEVKVKQEPQDPHENGFSSSVEASPRKKRRKQLLHATEELKDTPATEDDFNRLVEACVKEEKSSVPEVKQEIREEFVDEEGVRWTLDKKRPSVNLLNSYSISWKPKNNHFQRYTDVKPKEERRPTVNELSNQKGVIQKASGWKLFHMAAQIEDLVGLEEELNTKISRLQSCVAPRPPIKHSVIEEEPGMLHELTQGNIQRCQLVSDQLGEAKSAMLKVLDHKNRILEIITKHMSKRPIKKKERT